MSSLDVNNNNLLLPSISQKSRIRKSSEPMHPDIQVTLATPRDGKKEIPQRSKSDVIRRISNERRATINEPPTRLLEDRRKSRRSTKSANPRKKSMKREDPIRPHSIAVLAEVDPRDKWKEYARQNVDKIMENLETKSKDKWSNYVSKELKKHSDKLIKDMEKKVTPNVTKIDEVSEDEEDSVDSDVDSDDSDYQRNKTKKSKQRKKKTSKIIKKDSKNREIAAVGTRDKVVSYEIKSSSTQSKPTNIEKSSISTKQTIQESIPSKQKQTSNTQAKQETSQNNITNISKTEPRATNPPQITPLTQSKNEPVTTQSKPPNTTEIVLSKPSKNSEKPLTNPKKLERRNTEEVVDDNIEYILTTDDKKTTKPRSQKISVVLKPDIISSTEEDKMKKLEDSILVRHEKTTKKKSVNEVDQLIKDLQINT